MTAVSKIVCPIGRPRISFSFKVAITTPRATVIKIIAASITSLKRPTSFKTKASTTAVTTMLINAVTAVFNGSTVFPDCDFPLGLFFLVNKSKLISIPDRNISKITPRFDKKVKSWVAETRLKPLDPMIMPTMISATAVGTLLIWKRAIKIGITNANKTTKNSDNCAIILPFHQCNYTKKYVLFLLFRIRRILINQCHWPTHIV